MPSWIKTILALIVGTFTGGACIAVIEMLGHSLVTGQVIFIVAALGLGLAAFVGGLVAAWIGNVSILSFIVAVVLAGLALVNVFSFTHPGWYVPVAFGFLGIGAGAAYGFHKSRKAAK